MEKRAAARKNPCGIFGGLGRRPNKQRAHVDSHMPCLRLLLRESVIVRHEMRTGLRNKGREPVPRACVIVCHGGALRLAQKEERKEKSAEADENFGRSGRIRITFSFVLFLI